jgi:hypothetical protein
VKEKVICKERVFAGRHVESDESLIVFFHSKTSRRTSLTQTVLVSDLPELEGVRIRHHSRPANPPDFHAIHRQIEVFTSRGLRALRPKLSERCHDLQELSQAAAFRLQERAQGEMNRSTWRKLHKTTN